MANNKYFWILIGFILIMQIPADSDLSYDEVTEDGIRRREKERRRQRAGVTPLLL